MFKQEYEGSFQVLSGIVYYSYRPEYSPAGNLDTTNKYDPNLPVYAGIDFNVSPMTAVLGHRHTFENGGGFRFFRGYFLRDSNTRELCERIIADTPGTHTYYITPCQSSSARQTSQEKGLTDTRIIRDVFSRAGKNINFKKRSKNPLIKDRITATNSLLHAKRATINPDDLGLKNWMRDMESMTWKEGTSDLDLSDKMLGHISAAADYLIEYHFPVLVAQSGYRTLPGIIT
jgi:hypothetical protein